MYQPIHNSIKEGATNTTDTTDNIVTDLETSILSTGSYPFFNGGKLAPLRANIAISLDIMVNGITKDQWWPQIIGVTPSKEGNDERVIGIWFEGVNTTKLHIRAATSNNGNDLSYGNDDICSDMIDLSNVNGKSYIGKFVNICVIGNVDKSTYPPPNVQIFTVYIDGIPQKINGNNTTKRMALLYYPIKKTSVYVKSTYNNFGGFNGRIKNVSFGSSDVPLGYDTTQKQIVELKNGFTNMSDTNYKEGMTQSTTTTSKKADPSYNPIKDEAGKPICPLTVLYGDQDNSKATILLDDDLNFKTTKVPICPPDDIYKIEDIILKKINAFNAEYVNFVTFKYNSKHTGNGDTSEQLDYPSSVDISVLTTKYTNISNVEDLQSYKDLKTTLDTYKKLLDANAAYYPRDSSLDSNNFMFFGYDDRNKFHNDLMKYRNNLDNKLFELNNNVNSIHSETKLQMDSGIYVTILWTTLATSLVYYMFVHM
jgi:hypothetical protein